MLGETPAARLEAAAEWIIGANDVDREDVQRLLASHYEQMRSASPADACHVLALDGLRNAAISLWSLREGDRLIAVGALRQLDDDQGEIKSMRTAPEALGRGAGTAMLRHIIEVARRRGYKRLVLETGSTEPFQPALDLYAKHGFTPCAPFGSYKPSPFTRFLAKQL
jgi:putative acetyltransferase